MPLPPATRLLSRPSHRFRHHNRRQSALLLASGMLSIVTLVCLLLTPRLAAVESLARLPLSQEQASMTSSHGSAQKEPPPRLPAGLDIPHHHDTDAQIPMSNMATGTHHPPIAELPKHLISHLPLNLTYRPSLDPSDHQKKRVIFVGDVHGHIKSLKSLLHKIKFNEKNGDHLVFVGDLVNKGPDSAGVISLAMDVGASAVRGNHEDNVLRARHRLEKKKKHSKAQEIFDWVPLPVADKGADGSTFGSREALTETRKNHDDEALRIAKTLSKKQIEWLSSLPLMLRIDHQHGATHPPWDAKEIIVVHAGLVPGIPLAKQDPWSVMNMRTLLYRLRAKDNEASESHNKDPSATTEYQIKAIPSDARQGEPWSYSWNRFQNMTIPSHGDRALVIYGHDAKAGLQANTEVVIKPHPVSRWHGRKAHSAVQNRNDVNGIEVNIGPEIEVENDGDVAIDVESGVLINASTTTTTSDSEAAMKKRTDIEINVNPTEVLHADGDVEAEVEGEFEIEIENETGKRKKREKRDDDDDGDDDTIVLSVSPIIAVESDGNVEIGVDVDVEVAVVNGSVHIANGTMCKREADGTIVIPDGEDDNDDNEESGGENDIEAERKKKKGGKKGGKKRKGVRYAFGIDSGCGHGKKLTALILEATTPDGVITHRLVQTDCGKEER